MFLAKLLKCNIFIPILAAKFSGRINRINCLRGGAHAELLRGPVEKRTNKEVLFFILALQRLGGIIFI